MQEQTTIDEARAREVIADPRFGLGETWCAPAIALALAGSAPFEDPAPLGNAIRAFMSARSAPAGTDRFLKLWTAMNALCGHIAARFEASQAAHLHLGPNRLPARYRIQMIDNASMGALAALIDPAHPLPYFTALHSKPFREAQRTLGNLAEGLIHECENNPHGVLAQLSEAPSAPVSGKPLRHVVENPTADHPLSTCEAGASRNPTQQNQVSSPTPQPSPATEKLFSVAEDLGVSPLVFVLLVASYQLRNGLIHGSIPLPLLPSERVEGLEALDLCSFALDAFLDETLPRAVLQIQAVDGRAAPFPKEYRQTIARYLDHRFDGQGIGGILRKHGLFW